MLSLKTKKSTSGSQIQSTSAKAVVTPAEATTAASKKAKLKAKIAKTKGPSEDHVLGGADYVTLMMGGRRKAREEARKLPVDED